MMMDTNKRVLGFGEAALILRHAQSGALAPAHHETEGGLATLFGEFLFNALQSDTDTPPAPIAYDARYLHASLASIGSVIHHVEQRTAQRFTVMGNRHKIFYYGIEKKKMDKVLTDTLLYDESFIADKKCAKQFVKLRNELIDKKLDLKDKTSFEVKEMSIETTKSDFKRFVSPLTIWKNHSAAKTFKAQGLKI